MDFGDIKSFRDKSDFSLENRHLICISNKEYLNKNLVVLFYKKSDKKDKPIYDIFGKVGNSIKLINLQFMTCAVDSIQGLEKTFQEIATDTDHPYHWIKNRPKNEEGDRFPFILLYRKGFPQGFYEGMMTEYEFREFCLNTSIKSDFSSFLPHNPEERIKQQWIEYRKKEKEEPVGKTVLDAMLNLSDYSNKLSITSFLPISPKK